MRGIALLIIAAISSVVATIYADDIKTLPKPQKQNQQEKINFNEIKSLPRPVKPKREGMPYGKILKPTVAASMKKPVKITLSDGKDGGYSYVDLGLSVKWATTNVGAKRPQDCGDYYAWSEIQTKDSYKKDTYTGLPPSEKSFFGFIDVDIYGLPDYDAATAERGGNWRMPTDEEIDELIKNCDTQWVSLNGVPGMLFTSKINKHSIFLPGAGWKFGKKVSNVGVSGAYWTGSSSTHVGEAGEFFGIAKDTMELNGAPTEMGHTIRPVYEYEQ